MTAFLIESLQGNEDRPIYIHLAAIYALSVATITLKNIPKSLYTKLAKRAAAHKHSLSQEAILHLEETLQSTEPVPAHIWEERFQKVRDAVQVAPLTDEFLEWAVSHGRA